MTHSPSFEYQYRFAERLFDFGPTSFAAHIFTNSDALFYNPGNSDSFRQLAEDAQDRIFALLELYATPLQKQVISLSLQGLTQVQMADIIYGDTSCGQSVVNRTLLGNTPYANGRKTGAKHGGLGVKIRKQCLKDECFRSIISALYALEEEGTSILYLVRSWHPSQQSFLHWMAEPLNEHGIPVFAWEQAWNLIYQHNKPYQPPACYNHVLNRAIVEQYRQLITHNPNGWYKVIKGQIIAKYPKLKGNIERRNNRDSSSVHPTGSHT